MPDGIEEYDPFPEPLITPTTKAEVGHDEDITEAEILEQGLATPEEWNSSKIICVSYLPAVKKWPEPRASPG